MNAVCKMRLQALSVALVTLVTAGVTTVPAAAPAASAPARASVRIIDIDFSPRRVTIRRGGSVRWSFVDDLTPHNVRSSGRPRFAGSPTKEEGTYRVVFKRAGTYRYVCTIHLNMRGTVVVR